MVKTGQALNTY